MSDELPTRFRDFAVKCRAALEAFEEDTQPWNWLSKAADHYEQCADLIERTEHTRIQITEKE